MKKQQRSKLDSFADQLDHWLGVEKITLAQAVDRLRELGCSISANAVSHWWEARHCQAVEQQLAKSAPPPLETLKRLDVSY